VGYRKVGNEIKKDSKAINSAKKQNEGYGGAGVGMLDGMS
jgi:hypothetical protein